MSSKNNMKLDKMINYEFNKAELENKILELESKIQQLKNLRLKFEDEEKSIRKYKSEIEEYPILKHINNKDNVISIEYVRDYTEGNRKGKLSREEFKQNTLNCVGVDLLVERANRWVRVDIKVLKYYEKSKGKIYNGGLNEEYGVDNFVFQHEGRNNQLGWAWNRYKQTDELIILIPQVNRVYTFDYRKLVRFMSEKLKHVTIKDNITYFKKDGTKEICISVPMSEIPKGVIISIDKLEHNRTDRLKVDGKGRLI